MNYKHGCTVVGERNASNPKWKAYYTWAEMRNRCSNPKKKSWPDYGGRGITFDPAWEDFANFLADMGEPSPGITLERNDNDGPYCRDNCKWATRAEQNRNKRNNRYLEFGGERMVVADWAMKLGVDSRLLRVRLNRGWSVEDTLSRPSSAGGW
jgi:hypothetical protein